MKKFPVFFYHNRKAKFMSMDRALARAVAELYKTPARRYIEIVERSDERIVALIMRKQHGLVIEWYRRSIKRANLTIPTTRRPKKSSNESVERSAVH